MSLTAGLALGAIAIAHAATFRELPDEVKARIDLRLARDSTEIEASPFATLTSFEVHGAADDAGVVATMKQLGVKRVVMHNIHGSLPDPNDKRLNDWLNGCDAAKIEVRCILHSTDSDFWRTALRNYGSRIRHWSYLNEPNMPTNNDHTKPAWMPEKYAQEIAQIRKVVNEVDPGIKLYGPETAMLQLMEDWPFPWFRRCLDAGLLDSVDGISIHPYRQGYSPRNIPENPSTFEGRPGKGYTTYEEQIGVLRQMTENKPIVVNEVGWSTTPAGTICEHTQAKFALRQQIMDFALGIDCAVYFLLRERYVNAPFPLWHQENHFGIVHTDNSPKPAFAGLQTFYSQLDSGCRRSSGVAAFGVENVKWYLYEDDRGAIPSLKLIYWLPVPAQDDFPPTTTSVKVAGVSIPEVPISDAPRILRLHRVDGEWGYPVLIDLILQRIDDSVQWEKG